MSAAAASLLILAATVALFLWSRLPVEWIAVASALALHFAGVLTLGQTLAGFSDPAVLLIASLFVVSAGLDASGVTTWLGRALVGRVGSDIDRLRLLTMLLAALLTALIGINGAVASLLPAAVMVAMQHSFAPSRILLPMVFAGSAGGKLLLTGSVANVVISDAAGDIGAGAFGYTEFAWVGVPLLIGCMAVVWLVGDRLLPSRQGDGLPPNLSRHARTLVAHYSLEHVFHLRVREGSGLLGTPRDQVDLGRHPGVRLITVLDGQTQRPIFEGPIGVGDRLTLVGAEEDARRFASELGLALERSRTASEVEQSLLSRENGAAEVVIPPRSRYEGRRVRPGQVVDGDLIVLAVHRQGQDQGHETTELRIGDVLLVEGDWMALEARSGDRDLLVVDAPALIRKQTVPLGAGSTPALAILLAMVVVLASGLLAPVLAALLAAGAMILCRVVTPQQAYHGISWSTVLLVAGMMPMSTAIQISGAGDMAAALLVQAVGDAGPIALLTALFVLTALFGQLISNTATALIVIPVAVSAASQLQISPRPVLMSVCVATAAAFLTPMATPANMMVMGPGSYLFGDYWKLGAPLMGVFFVVAVFLVPLIWRY